MTALAALRASNARSLRPALRSAASRARARITARVAGATLAIAIAIEAWSMLESTVTAGPHLPPLPTFASTMIVNVLIAFSIMTTTFIADEIADGRKQVVIYGAAIVLGSAIGTLAQWQVHRLLGLPWRTDLPGMPADIVVMEPAVVFFEYLIWGSVAVSIYLTRRGELRAIARMNAAQLQRAEMQRRALEARLQTLQAQVEPQFLLDTLARVRDRYEGEPANGSAMLGALIVYLRAALPQLRESTSTVAREIDLAAAYIDVMRTNIGERVAFESEMPDSLRAARMPPMILLPLINHALAHRGRGRGQASAIRVRVSGTASRIRLMVGDDAGGFATATSDIDDIRRRVGAIYGDAGSLALEPAARGGCCAILDIPHEAADRDRR